MRRISAIAIAVAAVILVPLLATGWISFTSGLPGAGGYTLANYVTVATDAFGFVVLRNTMLFSVASAGLAMGIGAALAWAVARTDLPFKPMTTLLMGINLLIPGFVTGMAWALIASPRIGLVNRFGTEVLGLEQPMVNIFSLPGMTFVQGIWLVAPAYFILLPAFRSMDASFEEASYMSGASKLRTAMRINLRLAIPALAATAIYLFVLSFALFEIPAVLGMPDRTFVFSTMIYLLAQPPGGLPQYGLAAAYGSVILVMSIVLVGLYGRVMRQGRRYATITGKGWRARRLALGKWRPVATGLSLLYFVLALGLPILVVVYQSLLPFFQLPSPEALAAMSFQNYSSVLRRFQFGPFLNSGLLITVVPVVVIVLALPISWVVVRSRTRARFVLDSIAFLPLAVPRVVLAFAMFYLALIGRSILPLHGTLALIGIAYVIMLLTFATRALNGALLQVHPDLEEAGRMSGATATRTLARVTIPLVRPAVFFCWFWVLLLAFREVTVPVMLAAPGNAVLPSVIWDLWNTGLPQEAAAASTMLVGVALALMAVLHRLLNRLDTVGGSGT
jgi:iron(III) transport system permease protein